MLEILLSYFFILYITFGMGLLFIRWVKLDEINIFFTILSGLFTQLIFCTVYSIFFPLDFYFNIVNFAISTLLISININTAKILFFNTIKIFIETSFLGKVLFISTFVLALIHSSSMPFIADNESYYIQTIKWLNNYGLVKGVSNLHIFLAQFSGWHILQASFSFSSILPNLNDINGFLLIISAFFCLENWEKYKVNYNKNHLFISLIYISLIPLFLFISSPSPDFPLLIILPVIIFLFIELSENKEVHTNLITVLCLLIILIKVTIAPILLLLLITLIKSNNFKLWKIAMLLSSISFVTFLIKNIIISGYPLYPLSLGNELINVDWKLNQRVQELYHQLTSMYGWHMSDIKVFNSISFIDKFWIWLNLPKLHGLFNKLIILSMLLFPFVMYKRKKMYYIYIYFVAQFVVFYITSPQYRFFAPVLLSIGLIISVQLFHKRINIIKFLFISNIVIILCLGVFGLNFREAFNNNIMEKKESFSFSQIVLPKPITQFSNLKFTKHKINNLEYFSPSKDSLFFWQTSDGPLPCMNKEMIEYFSKCCNHIPQMRTKNMKDGFYSSKP